MENALIRSVGHRLHAYPLNARIRVACHLGTGDLRYVTDDGRIALHLDTDPQGRVEEVRAEWCRPLTLADHGAVTELARDLALAVAVAA